jgi:hypothetical protein
MCVESEPLTSTSTVQAAYAGVDRRTLQAHIDALVQSPRGPQGDVGSAPRLRRLYDLLLLDATVEAVRGPTQGGNAPQPFSGERSEIRSLFTEPASALRTGEPQAMTEADRRAGTVATLVLVEDLLRRSRPREALQKIETYRASMNANPQTGAALHHLAASAYQQQGRYGEALAALNAAETDASQMTDPEARSAYVSSLAPVRRGLQNLAGRSGTARAAGSASATTTKASGRTNSATVAGNASAQGLPQAFALQAPYPNPTRSAATVPLALPERSQVRAVVYDVLGRRMTRIADRSFAAGRPEFRFSTDGLPSGLYLIRVEVNAASGERHVFTEKVTVVR